MATLYSIGHSTRALAELVEVLQAHRIRTLVDIRAFPMSRRLPHFNRESLERELPKARIEYVWMKELGGYRKKMRDDSPHTALRSTGFRNYADYMLTPEFQRAAEALVKLAEQQPTAYMCAERLYFRCHRMMVSDYLATYGHTVLHIMDTAPAKEHQVTAEARLSDGQLIYDGGNLF